MFSIAICRHTGDKWQSKALFLSILDPRSSIVDSVFDCSLPVVLMHYCVLNSVNPYIRNVSSWSIVFSFRNAISSERNHFEIFMIDSCFSVYAQILRRGLMSSSAPCPLNSFSSFYMVEKVSGLILSLGFWGWLSIESQPQNAVLRKL